MYYTDQKPEPLHVIQWTPEQAKRYLLEKYGILKPAKRRPLYYFPYPHSKRRT